jgi:hypothetical protein
MDRGIDISVNILGLYYIVYCINSIVVADAVGISGRQQARL